MSITSIAAAFALLLASPSEEARKLMDEGKEKEAFELIEKAAAANDFDAIDYLAWFYDEGRYVAEDNEKAVRLYRISAEAGIRHSQWRLGVMLDTGEGVNEDPGEAVKWIRKAAEQGSAAGHVSMAVMYATGRGIEQNYERAMYFYREGARKGDAHGFWGVAVLYARGEGVAKDMQEALAWLFIAALFDNANAKKALEDDNFNGLDGRKSAIRANEILAELDYEQEIEFGVDEKGVTTFKFKK